MAPARHRYAAAITVLALTLLGLAGLSSPAQAATTARSITIGASAPTVTAGASVTFGGVLTKSPKGSAVTVQRKSGSTWVTAATTKTLSTAGVYAVAVKSTATLGKFTFRAIAPKTSKLSAATSKSTVTVTVQAPAAPTITTPTALPNAARGTAYAVTLTKYGAAGTWSVPDGSLPEGLALNPSTGKISGTPTGASGTYGVYPTFTDIYGHIGFKPLSLTITGQNLAITTATLPDAHVGAAYSVTLTKTGLAGTWATPQLPEGLELNETTGKITGTPTAVAGDYSAYLYFTETATDKTVLKSFLLRVLAPKVTTTALPDGTTGTAYSQQLDATGLAGAWTLTKGQLPTGVTLSPSGLLSGTPTTVGEYGITVTYTETSTGASDDQALLLHVSAPGSPVISTPNALPDAVVGTTYSTTLAATPTGGTWSLVYGSLPVGLELNASTGVISGTPEFAEDALFIAKYTKGSTSNTRAFGLSAKDPVATP